jgi:hypothetical protein
LSDLKFHFVTLAFLAMACVKPASLKRGRAAHGYAVGNNLESDITVACGLTQLYMSAERTKHAPGARCH